MKQIINIVLLLICLSVSSCNPLEERHQYAEMVIDKVEKFKSEHKQLPNNLTEFGLIEAMNSLAFYDLTSDSTYIVWYGMGVGESNVYYSSTKEWKIHG